MNKSHIADAARVIEWANENPRRPAQIAFTDGPERQAAYWIEWAENRTRESCAKAIEERGKNTKNDEWHGNNHEAESFAEFIRTL